MNLCERQFGNGVAGFPIWMVQQDMIKRNRLFEKGSVALIPLSVCLMLCSGRAQSAADSGVDRASHHQALDLARGGQYPRALDLLQELVRRHPDVYAYKADQALVTARSGDCRTALNLFERIREHPQHKPHLIVPIGRCLQELNRNAEALALLRTELRKHPDTQELKQALADAQHWEREWRVPDLNDTETLIELGAVELALKSLDAAGKANDRQTETLRGDLAVRHFRWGHRETVLDPGQRWHENDKVLAILKDQLARDPGNRRALYDLIVAYRQRGEYALVLENYDRAKERYGNPPFWVRQPAADAYLATGRLGDAEREYRQLLKERPNEYETAIGLHFVLIEQRRYDDARAVLDELAADDAWRHFDLEIQKGWWLLYSERHEQGRVHFEHLVDQAGANIGARQGEAMAYLWQGWPREAQLRLDAIRTRDENYVPARIGRVGALLGQERNREARADAEQLAAHYPDNNHAQNAVRAVETRYKPEIGASLYVSDSDRGTREWLFRAEVSDQVGDDTRLYGRWTRSNTRDQQYKAGELNRAGLGVHHYFNPGVRVTQEFSADVEDSGGDRYPGSYTALVLRPDDYWRFDLSYNSYAEDISLRARAQNIEADQLSAGVSYNGGLTWQWRAGASYTDFSDTNERTALFTSLDWTYSPGPFFRHHLIPEIYSSKNTLTDTPYFNPSRDLSLGLTHMTEWMMTLAPNYRHADRLFLTIGSYDQEGFETMTRWGVRYEQDYSWNDTTSLLWNIGYYRNIYDGNPEMEPRFLLAFRRRF